MRNFLSITFADRARLRALVKDRNASQKHVRRAQIALLKAKGGGTSAIMRDTDKSKTTVWRWQERFADEGFEGRLRDKTRPLAPLQARPLDRRARHRLELCNAAGRDYVLDGRGHGRAAGISVSIWRAHGPPNNPNSRATSYFRRDRLSPTQSHRAHVLPPRGLETHRHPLRQTRSQHRTVISGIVHVLKTGCRWRDVSPVYGPPTTIYNRYNRWSQRRVWQRIFEKMAAAGPIRGERSIDSSHVKAHRSASGSKGGSLKKRSAARGTEGRARFMLWPMIAADRSLSR